MVARERRGYSQIQIALHWLIFLLVLFQLVFGERIGQAADAAKEGLSVDTTTALLARGHIWFGTAILGLTALRLALRLGRGAPSRPAGLSRFEAGTSEALHIFLYVLLFLAPISGLVTYYITEDSAWIHRLTKPAFIIFLSIHAAAALYHHFIKRDDVLRRMLVPESKG